MRGVNQLQRIQAFGEFRKDRNDVRFLQAADLVLVADEVHCGAFWRGNLNHSAWSVEALNSNFL